MIGRALSEIAAAVRGHRIGPDVAIASTVTDSRVVEPGALFVALRGERTDGHRYLGEALDRGASAVLVDLAHGEDVDAPRIVVRDTGRALLDLAADERTRRATTRVVAITGANGKTSTKDLTAAVLAHRFRTAASPASFNNEVGLPMTLLGASADAEVIVAEMGARHEGDVALLCEIARPDVVVVTNVGVAHMEIFGSWDAIVRAGAEPVEALASGGVAIVNADDAIALGYADATQARVLTFSIGGGADVRAHDVALDGEGRARFTLEAGGEREPVELAIAGEHMVANALAASAVGVAFGMSAAECAAALKGARVSAWRMETFTNADGVLVVNDSYNANPESMAAGLKTARWIARGRRLAAVLGHMAELGDISIEEHERLGELVVRIGVERLVTVGEPARAIARTALREGQSPDDIASYATTTEAAADVRGWVGDGDVVLLKGSRVAGLEAIAEALR